MDLRKSVKSLKRKDCGLLRRKEFCFQKALRLKTAKLPEGISGLPAQPVDFVFANPHNCMSLFLNNLSIDM